MKRLENFPYTKVLVLGLAKSGTAAAELLLRSEVTVRVNDLLAKETDPSVVQLRAQGAEVIVGSHPDSILDDMELLVKNPGIPYDNPVIEQALIKQIPIITEVELAAQLAKEHELIGITGSNGKTTTTMLVYEMLKSSERKIKLAGNIGVVATEVAQGLEENERLLLELSSFQLLGVQHFQPHIAALLNLYAAHLDYHGSMEEYIQAKANIFRNQTETDYLVYNVDDERVRKTVATSRAQLVPFSKEWKEINGAWVDGEHLWFKEEKIISLQEIVLVGEHNLENILAAVSVAILSGATKSGIRHVLKRFSGVKHRLQFVEELNGRLFYNDSKATNMLATQKALAAFSTPTILLAGGLDRGDQFDGLIPYVKNVKACVLFGETKEKLAEMARLAKIDTIHLVEDVIAATKKAYELSVAGDVILLSPACASWDQYKTFEERGDMFIQTVHTLA